MFRKTLSLALVLTVLVASLVIVPAAHADTYHSAKTTLFGAPSEKLNNINLAVAALDGVYVPYGGAFSFNDIVGPRSKAAGYVGAINGRGAQVLGGGVSQVATTLYLTLMEIPGYIQFGEIATYGDCFTDNYVDDGDLAVITDYNAGYDLSFTNYAGNLFIEMWCSGTNLYCSITVSDSSSSSSGWFDKSKATLIATASIYCGDEASLLHNVKLAASSLDDTTLSSGNVFSFNDVVGPRSKEYGYKAATNGRGVKVVGGGVAQVASVVWLAVKGRSDIAIIEKTTYGDRYNQAYVANSSDAIVTDYNAGTDFSFRYTGTGSITIYTSLTDGILTCNIYK